MKGETIKVLLIDDEKGDYIITRELLAEVKGGKYALDWASSYEEGLKVAKRAEHDVCLVDYRLGQLSGVQLIRQARASQLTTPMILLTGQGSHDVDMEAMQAGATEYLVKGDTSAALLERTIRYAVELHTERSREQEALEAYAQKQAVIAEIGRLALTGGGLNELFLDAVSLVARTLGVEYCKLLELLPDGEALMLRAGVGWKEEYRVGQATVSAGKESQSGFTLLSGESLVVEDLRTEKRFCGSSVLLDHGVVSGVSVIIRGRERPYGVLGAHTASLRRFTTDDVSFLHAVANVLGEAIARKQAEDELRQSEASFRRVVESNKLAEATLLESEERYRLLFERNPQPMWVFDLETLSFLEVNDAAVKHYGYSREEFLTMTIKDIRLRQNPPNPPADIPGVTPQREEAGALKHRKKDGTLIDVEIGAHDIDFYGRAAQLVLAFDVTTRRTLEEQLRQSQKMEAVGRLAGGIAHDFNNLLTVINGYSDLTLRLLTSADALSKNLEEIKKAGNRAAGLTRQLLAFGRKQVLQPKVLDLNAVISDLEQMLQRVIGEDIDLQTILSPDLGRVNADPGQIEQVIMNLVVNARDAMPEGGKLTIETQNIYLSEEYARHHVAVKPGPYVRLAVSDDGLGMNDETKARLFEPFFTTKDLGKGTGLGLSTVYGIVKQSLGNIWVYSELGSGTTFRIYLPCVNDEVDDKNPRESSQPIALGSETLLLVEDDAMVRGLTRTTLEEVGYKVLQAANGAEALLICEQYAEPIHLLLTDVVMPGMSGRAVADLLTTLRPQMLVLYMSGYTEDAIVHHGVLNEGVNFIEKPFSPAALARKVRELLNAQLVLKEGAPSSEVK